MAHLSTAERIGLKFGREEGRREGKRDYLLCILAERFGPLSVDTIYAFTELTDVQLKQLGKDIWTADTLEQLALTGRTFDSGLAIDR